MMSSRAARALVTDALADMKTLPAGDLSALHLAQLAARHVETLLAATVAEAREAQRSWGAIGATMGISRQGARQRFGLDEDQPS